MSCLGDAVRPKLFSFWHRHFSRKGASIIPLMLEFLLDDERKKEWFGRSRWWYIPDLGQMTDSLLLEDLNFLLKDTRTCFCHPWIGLRGEGRERERWGKVRRVSGGGKGEGLPQV